MYHFTNVLTNLHLLKIMKMKLHFLENGHLQLNVFISEIRNENIQKDSFRFRTKHTERTSAGLTMPHGILNYLEGAARIFVAAYGKENAASKAVVHYAATPSLDDKLFILRSYGS